MVKVQYTDEKNALRRLAPHPFFPLESEKGRLVLPPLLLPKPDEEVIIEEEKRWKTWASRNGVPERRQAGSKGVNEEEHWMQLVRNQIKEHDEFAGQSIRSFIHAREATDELGQRYDWKMRLDPNEESDEEETDGAEDAMDPDIKEDFAAKQEEETWSLGQVTSFLNTGEV